MDGLLAQLWLSSFASVVAEEVEETEKPHNLINMLTVQLRMQILISNKMATVTIQKRLTVLLVLLQLKHQFRSKSLSWNRMVNVQPP